MRSNFHRRDAAPGDDLGSEIAGVLRKTSDRCVATADSRRIGMAFVPFHWQSLKLHPAVVGYFVRFLVRLGLTSLCKELLHRAFLSRCTIVSVTSTMPGSIATAVAATTMYFSTVAFDAYPTTKTTTANTTAFTLPSATTTNIIIIFFFFMIIITIIISSNNSKEDDC